MTKDDKKWSLFETFLTIFKTRRVTIAEKSIRKSVKNTVFLPFSVYKRKGFLQKELIMRVQK